MQISVFDMMKIGVGPSSSHTLGPWRAAQGFLRAIEALYPLEAVERVEVHLYGSLAKTGKGHGTDIAVVMGLQDADPVTCDTRIIPTALERVRQAGVIELAGRVARPFAADDLVFHYDESLPYHPNGLRFRATVAGGEVIERTYFSVGGGFVVEEGAEAAALADEVSLPYPSDRADDIQRHCDDHGLPIWQMVLENEKRWRTEPEVRAGLLGIWDVMRNCVYRGCHASGELPGGLRVVRRASALFRSLAGELAPRITPENWLEVLSEQPYTFQETLRWISCFALAVNEENAAFGRVVTAPTNGAAGVIPAVLLYMVAFHQADDEMIVRFLLVAGEIGSLFKKGATISAALGGCQAEIGVSSAMAAAALTECLGGSVSQALMAAEIAMEHHLGLTCDPIGGLVQIPCIERNAMGAMKAITAAHIALASDPANARVSLDGVIRTMWQTAQDMSDKYKETAEGGLAVHISVNVPEC